jgi:hypothetical protein
MTIAVNKTAEQAFQVVSVGSGSMGAARQALGETITYSVDYSAWLPEGEQLTAVDIFISPVGDDPVAVSTPLIELGKLVLFQLAGSTFFGKYTVTIRAATDGGQVKIDTFGLELLNTTSQELASAIVASPELTIQAFFASLPTSLPSQPGQLWWNGEMLSRS